MLRRLNTSTLTNTPTSTPTLIPGGPALPAGYGQTTLWGVTYRSSTVYIAKLNDSGKAKRFGQDLPQYRGYDGGNWYDLTLHGSESSGYYVLETHNSIYYSDTPMSGGGYPANNMKLPSGYEETDYWDIKVGNQTINICCKHENQTDDYLGFYGGHWYNLYYEHGSHDCFYFTGSDEVYYSA